MTERRFVIRLVVALAMLWPAAALAQTAADCTRNPDQTRWSVRAGAPGEAAGTNDRPFGSLAEVERCSPARSHDHRARAAGRRRAARRRHPFEGPAEADRPGHANWRHATRADHQHGRHRRRGDPRARQRSRASPHRQRRRSGDLRRQRQRRAPSRPAVHAARAAAADRSRGVALPHRQDRRRSGHEPVSPARLRVPSADPSPRSRYWWTTPWAWRA